MDLLNLGSQSRKTGLKPKKNLRKDKYDMEEVDDFFQEESDDDDSVHSYISSRSIETKSNYKRRESSIIPRKINFTDAEAEKFDLSPIMMENEKKKKNSLKSPLLEQEPSPQKLFVGSDSEPSNNTKINDKDDNFNDYEYDNFNDINDADMDLNDMPLDDPVISDDFETIEQKNGLGDFKYEANNDISGKSISSLTKNMALGKPTNAKRIRKKTTSIKRNSGLSTPKQISVKPSPLPSPPPDGLRRSRRTRIQPLAFWRNERIVYSRSVDDEMDPDITLQNDIRKIPLQEIKEIITVPDQEEYYARRRQTPKSPGVRKPKRLKNSKKTIDEEEYDYESDPEVEGSEWFKDNHLNASVYTSDDSETVKSIAYTQNFSDILQEPPKSNGSIDNYKIAPIFDENPNVAGALLELPREGFKSSKNSGTCIYMFHVIRGLLEITLSNNTFVVTRGCSFQVPTGNTYSITNVGNGVAKLFCVQALIPED